jgi:hypothetical protein
MAHRVQDEKGNWVNGKHRNNELQEKTDPNKKTEQPKKKVSKKK